MTSSSEIPQWETALKEIAPDVYAYIQAKGSWFWSNAGLIVGKDHAIVVDSLATVSLTQNFIKEIRRVTDKPIRFLVNTHHHGDHIWGNHLFEHPVSICHAACWQEIRRTDMYDPNILNLIWPEFDFRGIQVTPPTVTFDRNLTLHLDDREIQLIHPNWAHSPGDTLVHLPQEKVVFAGDLLFFYSTPVGFEASISSWVEAMDIMTDLNAETYIPGHGPVCGQEGVQRSREYLALVRHEARQRFDAQMSAFNAAKGIDLGPFRHWVNWERILVNVERLYIEFRGEPPTTEIDRAATLGQMQQLAADST
jgi:glyoxylase-like metal-dependent hydrolase (beta-lactamase superfamily II)